jgi:hypothetical protein
MAPPIPKGLTFKDLLTGLADVHKAAAAKPGAQAFEIRDLLRGKTHGEMAKIASDKGIFGTLPSGEPVRASVMSPHVDGPVSKNVPIQENTNDKFDIVLHGESKTPKAYREGDGNPTMRFKKDYDYDTYDYNRTGPLFNRIENMLGPIDARNFEKYKADVRAGRETGIGSKSAQMFQINAMDAGGSGPGWKGFKSPGTNLYQLGYDMSRAPRGEFGVTAGTLTEVNHPRRLRNVLSHYFGHGDFGTISPLNEEKVRGLTPWSSQSFKSPVDDINLEDSYLRDLLPSKFGTKLQGMGPRAFAGLTDDEMAGYMLLREAQLAGAYGPPTQGLGPFDMKDLRALSVPTVKKASEQGRDSILRAFGPNTLGRALTTEETVARMLRGQTPEEISYELFKGVPLEAIKGRYAKGGLATALDA